jgi:peroxiredoxin
MDEEGWEVVKPYLTDKAVNYPVVIGTDPVAQTYGGIDSLPSTFMIDKEGRIASAHIGLAAKKDFEDEINELLR